MVYPGMLLFLVPRVYKIIQVWHQKRAHFLGAKMGPKMGQKMSHFVGFEEERGCFGASGSIRDPSFCAQEMGPFLGPVLIKK